MYDKHGKRFFDFLLCIITAPFWLPLATLTAVVVWMQIGRPLLFRQQRPGRGERIFTLLKFRTMSEARDRAGRLLPDGQRMTQLGRFLRRTSLDELPEIWNVLRGEMSLVGPRPLLVEYLPRYSPEQRRRHDVRPGITGLAQVSGRNELSWTEKFQLDVEYVDNLNFVLDLKILAQTLALTVRGRGVHAPGHDTMPKFKGE